MPRSYIVFAVEHVAGRRERTNEITWPSQLVISEARPLRRLPLLEQVPCLSLRIVSKAITIIVDVCEAHVQYC